jgi:hypothetical protein
MINLPDFNSRLVKSSKVFALASVLSLCCACGGSQPSDTPEGGAPASPISGEVEIKGDEVASSNGEATAEEKKGEQPAEQQATAEQTSEVASSEEPAAPSEAAEVADNGGEQKKEKAESGPVRKNLATTKVRDPFDKYYGAPAIGTSLTGGVKPSTDRGNKGLNSAYKRKLAAQKAKDNPKPMVRVNKPDVKVTGILRSGSSYQAILQGPEKAIMVSPGQNISGYRVAAVTGQDVTLVYKGKYKFVIPLEKEVFGNTGNPDATAGNMSSNDGIRPPVVETYTK